MRVVLYGTVYRTLLSQDVGQQLYDLYHLVKSSGVAMLCKPDIPLLWQSCEPNRPQPRPLHRHRHLLHTSSKVFRAGRSQFTHKRLRD